MEQYSYTKGEYLELVMLNEDKFGGYFFSQNNERTRLSLYNVKQLPKGDPVDFYNFSTSDIKSIYKASNDMNDEKDSAPEKFSIKYSCDVLQPLPVASSGYKFIFINQVDNRYHEAMLDLKCHLFISIGTEGAELGRKCKLPILTLSTPTQIYIFDIQAMQESAFDSGIRHILESDDITKIIHNSRKISDCLFHKHGVQLKKVFDTQAADVIVQKQRTGSYPKEVRSLQECLKVYLNLCEPVIKEKVDIVELVQRPLKHVIKETVSNNIIYMHRLYQSVYDQIMAPYLKGSEFYINCQRQCNDSDAWYICSQDKKVPKLFSEYIE